tara:strand:- start:293 stop:658 length:366 start_codon:yes stop_codon:yes gene_type:complete
MRHIDERYDLTERHDPDFNKARQERFAKTAEKSMQDLHEMRSFIAEWYCLDEDTYDYSPYIVLIKQLEEGMRSIFQYTMNITCEDCRGTGGLHDSALGIQDDCTTCGGTGDMFSPLNTPRK